MNRNELRNALRKRDGTKCHYCNIEEADFIPIWGPFYKTTGKRLEVDHKDNNQRHTLQNCVLACALCNNAKSNKFTYEEFKRVGDVIKDIWAAQNRAREARIKHVHDTLRAQMIMALTPYLSLEENGTIYC